MKVNAKVHATKVLHQINCMRKQSTKLLFVFSPLLFQQLNLFCVEAESDEEDTMRVQFILSALGILKA